MTPFTSLLKRDDQWSWTDVQSQCFHAMKQTLSSAVQGKLIIKATEIKDMTRLHSSPDLTIIHTDTSFTQTSTVISKNGRPIALVNKQLTPAQQRYTTTEQELLGLIARLQAFHTILTGPIIIHTDNKHLLSPSRRTWVQRSRTILQQFDIELNVSSPERPTSPARQNHIVL